MQQVTRLTLAASVGALTGALVCGLCIYFFLAEPYITVDARSAYSSAIAQANLATVELRLLRSGQTSQLTDILESTLDSHLLEAAAFEEVNPDWRDRQTEEAMSAVRNYRLLHPSAQADKSLQEKITNVLAPKPTSNPSIERQFPASRELPLMSNVRPQDRHR